MGEIVKYELSLDRLGVVAILKTGESYHIHSNEMTDLEIWIHGLLKGGK